MILLNGKKDDTQVAATGHDSLTLNTSQFLGQSPLLTMVYGKHERFKWRPKKIRSENTPHGGRSMDATSSNPCQWIHAGWNG